jgi:hypothetical protein
MESNVLNRVDYVEVEDHHEIEKPGKTEHIQDCHPHTQVTGKTTSRMIANIPSPTDKGIGTEPCAEKNMTVKPNDLQQVLDVFETTTLPPVIPSSAVKEIGKETCTVNTLTVEPNENGMHPVEGHVGTTSTERIIRCQRNKGIGCGNCEGCQVPCCGVCRLCCRCRGPANPQSACAFRDCIHLIEKVRKYRQKVREELECQTTRKVSTTSKHHPDRCMKATKAFHNKASKNTKEDTMEPETSISDSGGCYETVSDCGVCFECTKPVCGMCRICINRDGISNFKSACIYRLCPKIDPQILNLRELEQAKMSRSSNHDRSDQTDDSSCIHDKHGWWDGNGIDPRRAAIFAKLDLQRCGTCPRCCAPPCNICGLCRYQPQLCCILQCCDSNDLQVKIHFATELNEMQRRENRCLEIGSPIWCMWKENMVWKETGFYWVS